MTLFKSINPGVEVNGETVLSIVKGMGSMQEMGYRILSENGIDNPEPGKWYSQQKWLDAFKEIAEKIGTATLLLIGKSIPDSAQFPPEIDTIEKALASIDVAYHMNHRLNGTPLFNPKTGTMGEGIGHYAYKKLDGNKAEIVCDNPYPCNFDKGIIEAMAKRFKPEGSLIKVTHNEGACRTKGATSCTYTILW